MIISISIKILLSLLVLADKAKGTAKEVGNVGLGGSSKLVLVDETAPAGRAKDHDFTRSNARI